MFTIYLFLAYQNLQVISSNWEKNNWIDPQFQLEIEFNASPQSLAIVIGTLDCTSQFQAEEQKLVYHPHSLVLPPGEQEIIVYQKGETWQEVTRIPLKVLTVQGLQKAKWSPNLQVTLLQKEVKNQTEKQDFGEFAGNFNLQSHHQWSNTEIQTTLQITGNSEPEKALRFYTTPDDAPKLDLAQYAVHLKHRSFSLDLGQVTPQSHRHLIQVYGHRGLQARWKSSLLDLGLAAFHTTSLAGYDNITGLSNSENQVRVAQLAFEILKRPGGFRLELVGMQGKRLANPGFDVGEIADSQEQTGYGFKINASTANQRLRTHINWAASDFTNPTHSTWQNQHTESSDNAFFIKVQGQPLQNIQLANQALNISLESEFESIDPLYQSVGVFTQRDLEQLVFRGQLNWGSTFLQTEWRNQENNLDEIPSILKTKTAQSNHQITLPTKSWMAEKSLVPNLNFSFQSSKQKGEYLPENGGFNESHVPDQKQDQVQIGLDWSGNTWSFNYQFSYAHTDNRQPGRENADFKNGLHGIQTFFQLGNTSQFSMNWSQNLARNIEQASKETTDQYGFSWNWNPNQSWSTSLNYQKNLVENPFEFSQSENVSGDARLQYQLNWGVWSCQAYTQYQIQQNGFINQIFGLDDETEIRSWSLGLNISMQ